MMQNNISVLSLSFLFIITFLLVSNVLPSHGQTDNVSSSQQQTKEKNKGEKSRKNAVVTLVSGINSGYSAGALALGQSIIDIGSKLKRICMVTPEVDDETRKRMSHIWEVIEVKTVTCNHRLDPSVNNSKSYDLKGEKYQAGLLRWSSTCTKFAAWTLTQFDRIIFMDSDMLVVGKIDDAISAFSNASFLASPESFPPDTFNSGFMVLTPSMKGYENLLKLNERIGSSEGGDQGVFNNGLCPQWFQASRDDPDCGRLPWIFNVESAHYTEYETLRKMSGLRKPSVIHFVSDGKPWKVLMYEYHPDGISLIPGETKRELKRQAVAHMLWRNSFFRATGEVPKNDLLIKIAEGSEEEEEEKPSSSKRDSGKERNKKEDQSVRKAVSDDVLKAVKDTALAGRKAERGKVIERLLDSKKKGKDDIKDKSEEGASLEKVAEVKMSSGPSSLNRPERKLKRKYDKDSNVKKAKRSLKIDTIRAEEESELSAEDRSREKARRNVQKKLKQAREKLRNRRRKDNNNNDKNGNKKVEEAQGDEVDEAVSPRSDENGRGTNENSNDVLAYRIEDVRD